MTAAVLRNALDVPDVANRSSKFFEALAAADQHIVKAERDEWVASFAPPVTSYRSCVCGSVMEKRGSDQIVVTDDEKLAAAEAVGDCMGRPLDDFTLAVATHVLLAINGKRQDADVEADRDWYDAHAYCGDDQ